MDVDQPVPPQPSSQQDPANKRKRVNTNGDAEEINTNTNTTSAQPQGNALAVPPVPYPADWSRLMADTSLVKPTPAVVRKFAEFYNSAISHYSNAIRLQTKRIRTAEAYEDSVRKGETPPVVSESLRGPSLTMPPGLASGDEDEAFKAARLAYNISLAETRRLATAFMTAGYNAIKIAGDLSKLAQSLQENMIVDLQSYAYEVLKAANAPKTLIWSPFIDAVGKVLGERMTNLRIDYVTSERTRIEDSTRKTASLATATAEAETKAASKSVQELVQEELELYIKRNKLELKRKEPDAASNSQAKPAKKAKNDSAAQNTPASTSKSNGNGNAQEPSTSKNSKPRRFHSGGAAGNGGGGGGNKAQGKAKAKAK
ncbi:unnamed protein product [Peniophora sp. CBMAI 1063]|nr:unnamed protein product [Peniophora sp. CBMAI 1063]